MEIKQQPVGIVLPVAHGPLGYFNQSFSVVDQVKSNLTMLFRTKKGERRMNPGFGSELWNVLFELNDNGISQIAESAVKRDVSRWMPYVNIVKVLVKDVDSFGNKSSSIKVSISFTVNGLSNQALQSLDISVQQQAL